MNASDVSENASHANAVEMPKSTAWPLVLGLGITLLCAGVATSVVLSMLGLVMMLVGLAGWIGQLLPGKGHMHEALAAPELRAGPLVPKPGTVDQLRPGMAGFRFRLPEKVHPISAGLKGGILGGLLMPIPALIYGIVSGHGIWFPINLLAGMVVPGITDATTAQLEQFHPGAFLVAIVIHAAFSVTFGLLFGVISPTLPPLPGGPLIAGGVLMPILWTALCYGFMGIVNPALQEHVNWPWFIASQFVYGLAMSWVVLRIHKVPVAPAWARPGQPEEPPPIDRVREP